MRNELRDAVVVEVTSRIMAACLRQAEGVAGTPLGPTGGHGDAVNGLRVEFADIPHISDNVIDSPEAGQQVLDALARNQEISAIVNGEPMMNWWPFMYY